MKVKKGQIIVIMAGDYDDYRIYATSIAKKDFDLDETFELFDEFYQMEGDPENSSETKRMEIMEHWLIYNRYIELRLEFCELHW